MSNGRADQGREPSPNCCQTKGPNFLRKRYYILLVTRDAEGQLRKIPIPLHYLYVFLAGAVIGMFSITGMAGSTQCSRWFVSAAATFAAFRVLSAPMSRWVPSGSARHPLGTRP